MICGRNRLAAVGPLLGIMVFALPTPAAAQSLSELGQQIEAMQRELAAQRSLIADQAKQLARQQQEIDRLHGVATLADKTGETRRNPDIEPSAQSQPAAQTRVAAASMPLPTRPVGGSLNLPGVERQVDAVLEGMGVLTGTGHVVLEPSVEYTNSSNNRLVFRGVELIPGIQIGQIEANNAARNTVVTAATVRYGLTRNLEVEARVPYLFRSDRSEEMGQSSAAQTVRLNQRGLGDVEFGLRYQLNRPIGEKPILIGTFRLKTATGRSPYDVPFDQDGVAQGLATGSGFWAVQPGLNFLLPSDPVVLFGGMSYLYQIPRTINRTVGGVLVGRVDPGNAISANLGFGFALNPRFSFSLGYQHTYIFPMHWYLGGVASRSDGLQAGVFALGLSYRVSQRRLLNFGLELGATQDAPDVSLVLRVPIAVN